jgi:hypothetical protein
VSVMITSESQGTAISVPKKKNKRDIKVVSFQGEFF